MGAPFEDGEPTAMTFATSAEAEAIKARLVAAGRAVWSEQYPGRLELVSWRPVVPSSPQHRRQAQAFAIGV